MKKNYLTLCCTLFLALTSCEKDDLRKDIDNLENRIAYIEAGVNQLNEDIETYHGMLTGKILVTEYTQDEATGDYTVKLTD